MSKKKIDRRKYISSYQECFDGEAGKIVLADLVERFRVMRPFPMKSDTDVAFCEGQRQVVLYILSVMNYDLNKLTDLKEGYSTEVNYE